MANPLNRQSFSEILKYNVDGCNLQASMKNNYFVRKVFTEFQELSKMKISCPLKKVTIIDYGSYKRTLNLYIFQGQYRIRNWIITDDLFPKASPRNIKGIGTFKFFTNISNTKIEIWKVKVFGEFK